MYLLNELSVTVRSAPYIPSLGLIGAHSLGLIGSHSLGLIGSHRCGAHWGSQVWVSLGLNRKLGLIGAHRCLGLNRKLGLKRLGLKRKLGLTVYEMLMKDIYRRFNSCYKYLYTLCLFRGGRAGMNLAV